MNSENEKWAEVSRTASAKWQLWRAARHPALHLLLWTKLLQQGVSAPRHLCHAFWKSHASTSSVAWLTFSLTGWDSLNTALSYPKSLFLNWLPLSSYLVQLVAIILLGLLLLDTNFYSDCICFQWKFFTITSEEKIHFYMLESKYQTVVRVYLLWTGQRSSSFTLSTQ